MKALSLIFRALMALIILAAGISLLYVALMPEGLRNYAVQMVFNFVQAPLYLRVLPGLLLLVFWFMGVVPMVIGPTMDRSVLAFSTPNGPVEISQEAVKDFVSRLCKSIGGVRNVLDVHLKQNQGDISVRVRLTLNPGCQVPEIISRCQDRIKQELASSMGLEKISRIAIIVEKIEEQGESKNSNPAGFPFVDSGA